MLQELENTPEIKMKRDKWQWRKVASEAEVIAGYWTSYLVPNNVVIPYVYNKIFTASAA